MAYLQQQGYQIVRGRSAYEPLGYLSGTDDARLTELNRFLRSDDVQALFCVRGGYGSLRLSRSTTGRCPRRNRAR